MKAFEDLYWQANLTCSDYCHRKVEEWIQSVYFNCFANDYENQNATLIKNSLCIINNIFSNNVNNTIYSMFK